MADGTTGATSEARLSLESNFLAPDPDIAAQYQRMESLLPIIAKYKAEPIQECGLELAPSS